MLAASYARLGQREEAREALQLSPAHWGIYAGGGFLVGVLETRSLLVAWHKHTLGVNGGAKLVQKAE